MKETQMKLKSQFSALFIMRLRILKSFVKPATIEFQKARSELEIVL